MTADWYELERYVKGRWMLDAVFDDKDLAISEGERLIEDGHAAGVRVVCSIDTDHLPQTVFRKSKAYDSKQRLMQDRALAQDQGRRGRRNDDNQSAPLEGRTLSKRREGSHTLSKVAKFALTCLLVIGTAWFIWTHRSPTDANYADDIGSNAGPTIHWGGR